MPKDATVSHSLFKVTGSSTTPLPMRFVTLHEKHRKVSGAVQFFYRSHIMYGRHLVPLEPGDHIIIFEQKNQRFFLFLHRPIAGPELHQP